MENNITGSIPALPDEVNLRRSRPKTMRIKTLLIVLLLVLIIAAIIFGILYYLGKRPMEDIQPASPISPPHFLYSIYEGKNKFSHPIAVAVDKSGKFYVSNNDLHTIEVISPNGKPETAFGGSGQITGKLLFPYGIGILPNGNLLVAETGNFRIQEFTPNGKYVRTFVGQPNKIGLIKPGPIYVDSIGHVYVGDLSGNQVLILDQKGKVLRRIGNIFYPHGIAVDEERKKLFVSDSGEVNVKAFSLEKKDNKPLQVIETMTSGARFSMARGLAVDKKGRLYVADTIVSAVRVFDKNGEYLFSFGQQGFDDGEFLYPNGIFIDDTGKIYIADWSNDRIQIWGY